MQEEHDLIRRAQEYDPAAFGAIYERYYNGVYKYIYYRVGDQGLAEDLTMEVFVKALEAIEGFTFRGVPFSAWLYRIASNLVTDRWRQSKGRRAVSTRITLCPSSAISENFSSTW